MYISPVEYIKLTDRIQLLTTECSTAHLQNQRLLDVVLMLEEQVKVLQIKLQQQSEREDRNHGQLLGQVSSSCGNVKDEMEKAVKQQSTFVEEQVRKIKEDVNVKKVKELEQKMTENRLKNHEMVDFYNKVKTLFTMAPSKKKDPTPAQLYQWIKNSKIVTSHSIKENNQCPSQTFTENCRLRKSQESQKASRNARICY